MYHGDPFEQPSLDVSIAWSDIPPWVRVALWGPWALILASIAALQFGAASPTFFLVAAGSAALGFGAVMLACVSKLLVRLIRGAPNPPA